MIYFVGEKRSGQAIRNNWHWDDHVSTARFLVECLSNVGIYPMNIIFTNLWSDSGKLQDGIVEILKNTDYTIVGMGNIVSKELDKQGIEHIKIVHPAARGKIRKKERYIAHLKEKLADVVE